MEKATTDIYSFRKLRENGFTYVDKTAQILPLVDMSIGTQFFLARPRRFGKSLLVSTLHCLFEGRRDFFRDLPSNRSGTGRRPGRCRISFSSERRTIAEVKVG